MDIMRDCVYVICAGQLAACMQLCYNDADAVICFCHLSEERARESDELMCVYEIEDA